MQPDVIHSYSFYTNVVASLVGLLTRRTAVGAIQSDFASEKRLAGPIAGRLSGRWPRVQIVNSSSTAEVVAADSGCFRPREVRVVRNALDLSEFSPSAKWPRQPTLLGVGSLFEEKGWDFVVRAFREVTDRFPDAILRLAGEGPSRRQLEALITELGLARQVELLGERHDIPELLGKCSLLIHGSYREGTPNVVMEALASGRAVVATDVGDVKHLVMDGRTGFIVPRGDIAALADRVTRLLEQPSLLQEMGVAARRKAEADFTVDRLISETLAAYPAAVCAPERRSRFGSN